MAFLVADRVQEYTSTSGTGTLTLTGAVPGFQTFSSGIGSGNSTFYTIYDNIAQAWEVGIGTVGSGTLSRDTVLSNSLGTTAKINLAGNQASVFVTYPAEKSVNLDVNGNVILPNSLLVENGVIAANSILGGSSSTAQQNQMIFQDGFGTKLSSLLDGKISFQVGTTGSVQYTSYFDESGNLVTNSITQSLEITTSSAGIKTLTPASPHFQILIGTSTHTFKLPDATSLLNGSAWIFDNDSTQNLTVTNNAGATIDVVAPGGYATVFLESNGTIAGLWGRFGMIPSEVNWGTNSLDLGGSTVITNGIWQGTPIAYNYGGTTLTTFGGANNALYSTSATALTAGTLPAAAGGTGLTSPGTAGNVLTSTGTGWSSAPIATISADDAYYLAFMMG